MHCCVTMHTVLNMSLTLIIFTLVFLMGFNLPRKNIYIYIFLGEDDLLTCKNSTKKHTKNNNKKTTTHNAKQLLTFPLH